MNEQDLSYEEALIESILRGAAKSIAELVEN
jgi:hypothetical protein